MITTAIIGMTIMLASFETCGFSNVREFGRF